MLRMVWRSIYMPVVTSTTIRNDVFDDIKMQGWKVSELVLLGYEVRKNLANTKSDLKIENFVDELKDSKMRQETMKTGIQQLNFRVREMNEFLLNKGLYAEVDRYVESKLSEKAESKSI